MPKKNNKHQPMLRVRVDDPFIKEIDDYITAANRSRRANPIDRSYLMREAVVEFMERHPVGEAA